ncbi:hypothetical protein RB195_016365 [Necator americanus]|uniref:PDZ domain-containing protein n=1 Tax=Necator americanus TaxID=51031 RepID=A0ABR1E8T7_NECAM
MDERANSQDPDLESSGFTSERQRNIVVRPGFAYYMVILRVTRGLRFGLGIKHYRNMVIVSKVEKGTLSADAMKVGDHIIDVNGIPVTDKNVAKSLIIRSLQTDGTVNMIVERAVDPAALALVEGYLTASQLQPPSITMASDVKSIVQRYFEKLKMGHGKMKPVPVLRPPDAPQRDYGRVQFEEGAQHKSIQIGMDNLNRAHLLKKVPSKPGPQSRESESRESESRE